MTEDKNVVYIIENRKNGKWYVGQTIHGVKRRPVSVVPSLALSGIEGKRSHARTAYLRLQYTPAGTTAITLNVALAD